MSWAAKYAECEADLPRMGTRLSFVDVLLLVFGKTIGPGTPNALSGFYGRAERCGVLSISTGWTLKQITMREWVLNLPPK